MIQANFSHFDKLNKSVLLYHSEVLMDKHRVFYSLSYQFEIYFHPSF